MDAARSPAQREQRLTVGVLSHLPLFASVASADLVAVAAQYWTLGARRGDLIAKRALRLPGLFAVAYGSVKLTLRSAEGEERVLRLVSAGQTFGEPSALLGQPSLYDALALAECKLVVLPCAPVFALAERDARFSRNVMMLLARRAVETLAELEAATLQRGAQRLAAYLGSLATDPPTPGPIRVELPVSKTMLAARLGVKKETLSRLLRQLAAEGVIVVARREIAILDRERLAAMVQS